MIAHDKALFDHAQLVQNRMCKSKESAISEWLKTKSKEEQLQYLDHHKSFKISEML